MLCDAERLNEIVGHATTESKYRDDLVRRFAHFQPLEGVVYLAREEIQGELAKGSKGVQKVALVMAEEFTHALTTFEAGHTTRTGFIRIPHEPQQHGLVPGAIYEHELDSDYEESDDDVLPLSLEDLLLTENTTQFLLHGLLENLQTALPRRKYPYIALTLNNGRSSPIVIQKSPRVHDLVTLSLVRGDKNILREPFDGKLLPLLEDPRLRMASLAQLPPRKDDDIFAF